MMSVEEEFAKFNPPPHDAGSIEYGYCLFCGRPAIQDPKKDKWRSYCHPCGNRTEFNVPA